MLRGLVLGVLVAGSILATSPVAVAQVSREEFEALKTEIETLKRQFQELMRALRSRYGMPGIAVSGYATPADASQSRAAGFDRHLNKPMCYDDLLQAIAQLFTAPAAGAVP